jgi:hypothetical protein
LQICSDNTNQLDLFSQAINSQIIVNNAGNKIALLYKAIPDLAKYTHIYTDPLTGQSFIDFNSDITGNISKYGCGTPAELINTPQKATKKRQSKEVFDRRYPDLIDSINQRENIDAILTDYYQTHISATPAIGIALDGIKRKIYRLPVRGEYRYNQDNKQKINQYIAGLEELCPVLWFVTFTVAPNELGLSVSDTWDFIKQKLPPVLKKIHRKHGGKHVWVKESMMDGKCHIHIAFAFPNAPLLPVNIKGKWRTNNRYMRWELQTAWDYGYVDVELIPPGKAQGYMSKYISKGFKTADGNLQDITDDEQRNSERKGLLALALAEHCGCRLFSASKGLRTKNDVATIVPTISEIDEWEKELREAKAGGAKSSDLKKLLNKWDCPAYKQVVLATDTMLKDVLTPTYGVMLDESDPVWRFLQLKGKSLGCPGCKLMDYVDKVKQELGFYPDYTIDITSNGLEYVLKDVKELIIDNKEEK